MAFSSGPLHAKAKTAVSRPFSCEPQDMWSSFVKNCASLKRRNDVNVLKKVSTLQIVRSLVHRLLVSGASRDL